VKLVFFGTSGFAVPALRALQTEHEILRVITQPDRRAGRGQRMTPTPVKAFALAHGLALVEPLRLRGEIEAELTALGADAAVVVAYGRMLPPSLLALGKHRAFNLHPSALPLYRGATPIAGAIRDGRRTTDICVIRMDEGLDTGDVVARATFVIAPDETGTSLHDRLAEEGAPLILSVLAEAERGTLTRQAQAGLASEGEIAATATRPLRVGDLVIDWSRPAAQIVDMVRAYAERPAARAELGGERIKVLRAAPSVPGRDAATPGSLLGVLGEAVLVACGDGVVAIDRLIAPDRPPQSGTAFFQSRARA
jgi:methionyl-tRNA formyltransferase